MREGIEVIPINELAGTDVKEGNADYLYKPIVAPQDAAAVQCHIAVIEIMPGKQSFPYHYHDTDEEAFYIIRGQGTLRTPQGKIPVKGGDCILLPPGPDNAHSISNTSDSEKLVYIDFDTHNLPEITHFPDTGKIEVLGASTNLVFEENAGRSIAPRLKHGMREN